MQSPISEPSVFHVSWHPKFGSGRVESFAGVLWRPLTKWIDQRSLQRLQQPTVIPVKPYCDAPHYWSLLQVVFFRHSNAMRRY